MTREESINVAAKMLAAVRDIDDPTKQVKAGAKVLRQLINQILDMPDNPHAAIKSMRSQIVDLQTELLKADVAIGKRVVRNVELVKKLAEIKQVSNGRK